MNAYAAGWEVHIKQGKLHAVANDMRLQIEEMLPRQPRDLASLVHNFTFREMRLRRPPTWQPTLNMHACPIHFAFHIVL